MRAPISLWLVFVLVFTGGLVALPPLPAQASAVMLDPPDPPAPINPAPYMTEVSTPGPTHVGFGTSYEESTHMVWGPIGSPYIVHTDFSISASQTLVLLPGTVVKFEVATSGQRGWFVNQGTMYALGTPDQPVVFTSLRDDSVMGDTNGDGSATVPAPGDWYQITVGYTGANAIFNYVDVRYGGYHSMQYCGSGFSNIGAVNGTKVIIANSRITNSFTAGIGASSNSSGYLGVFNTEIDYSHCGLDIVLANGHTVVAGNTFGSGLTTSAVNSYLTDHLVFQYNTVHRPISTQFSGSGVDVRFNRLLGGISNGSGASNWYGVDVNNLPACMTAAAMAAHIPTLQAIPGPHGCPAGTFPPQPVLPVLPSLSAPPLEVPESFLKNAAASYGPVDTSRGVLRYQATDMEVEDAGMRLTATRSYRSDTTTSADLGPGWTSAFAEAMSTLGGISTLTMSNGSTIPFSVDPAAGYVPAAGVVADFTTGAGGSTVTSADRTSYQFNAAGELTGMLMGDPGRAVDIDRVAGKVVAVNGISGRSLGFTRSGGLLTQVTDSQGRSVGYAFTGGRLAGATGVDGQQEDYEYDASGRLIRVIAPSGLVRLEASYQVDGKVAWVEQPGTGRSTFAYDTVNRKTTITRANGSQIIQQYDQRGLLVAEKMVGGAARHVIHDHAGRVIAQVAGLPSVPMNGYLPVGQSTHYDKRGDAIMSVDPRGLLTRTTFNSAHKPLVTTYPDGSQITRSYDGNGRLQSVTNQTSHTWNYTYNSRGQVLTEVNPLTQTRTLTYEADGDLSTVTDVAGAVITYEYDALGRRTAMIDPQTHRTEFTYKPWGAVATVELPSGAITEHEFDVDRRPTAVEDPLGHRTVTEYDTAGRPATTVDALNQEATLGYDSIGRVTSITDLRGGVTELAYSVDDHVISWTDSLDAVTTAANDPLGRPIRVTDDVGAVTQYTYAVTGQVIKIERPDGSVEKSDVDIMGRPSSHVSGENGTTSFLYDLAGRMTKATDPIDKFRTLTYDALGRTLTATNELSQVTNFAYDDVNRKVTTSDSIGTISVQQFDWRGNLVSATDGAGGITTFEYDADGRQTAVVDPEDGRVEYGYDLAGRLTTTTDQIDRVTTATLDALGRPTVVTDAAGETTGYTYEPDGQVATVTDRAGKVWSYDYDIRGLLTSVTNPLNKATTYEYDTMGRLIQTTDPTGVEQNVAYDPVGRAAVEWDVTGAAHVYTYDHNGNLDTHTDPAGVDWNYTYNKRNEMTAAEREFLLVKWTYTYDAAGRLVTIKRPNTTPVTTYGYDQRGRLTSVTDETSNVHTYTYDGAGRQLSATAPSTAVSSWTYDLAGRMLTATDAEDNTTEYEYDPAGQLTHIQLPRGGTFTYTHTPLGDIASETNPLSLTTEYFYDEEQRPIRTETPAGRVILSRYDDAGQVAESEAGGVIRTFGYDDAGRLASASVPGQTALGFTYNSRGLMATSADWSGTTTYAYDTAGRISTVTPPTGAVSTYTYVSVFQGYGLLDKVTGPLTVDYGYDYEGRVTSRAFSAGNSRTDTYTYGLNARLTGIKENASAATTLTYDVDGRLATSTEPVSGGNPKVSTYGYDDAGRLTSLDVTQGSTTLSAVDYGWDDDGNRTSVTEGGGTPLTFSYNLAGQVQSSSDGATYTHDDDGNRTEVDQLGNLTSLGFNAFGELDSAEMPSGALSTYLRDPMGRVSASTTGATTQRFGYLSLSDTVSRTAIDGGATTNLIHGVGNQVVAQQTVGGTTLRPARNRHGDVTGWQNHANGTVTATTSYDPFGKILSSTGTAAPANLGFQSSRTDSLTGLTDMGFRSYDPRTAQFTAADNIIGNLAHPGALNRFGYGFSDPVNYFDPDGHLPQWLKDVGHGIGDYFKWWTSAWNAGWNDTEPTVKAPEWVDKVNTWVDENKAEIVGFAVSGVVFVGCEIAIGVPTAGVGAVAGAAGCSGLAGIAGGLASQAVRCAEKKQANACDPAEFAKSAFIDGISGLVGGMFGGPIGSRLISILGRAGFGVFGRTVTGIAVGMGVGALGGGAGGGVASGAAYALNCGEDCSWSGFKDATWQGVKSGMKTGALMGGLGSIFGARRPGLDCGGGPKHSFDPQTRVLMADGSTKRIADIEIGDQVKATDPETGKTTAQRVTALHINQDTELTDVVVSTAPALAATATLQTTAHHPFWDTSTDSWVDAAELEPGESTLTGPDGETLYVREVRNHSGNKEMRDLTVNEVHTYYAVAGDQPALVHNCADSARPSRMIDSEFDVSHNAAAMSAHGRKGFSAVYDPSSDRFHARLSGGQDALVPRNGGHIVINENVFVTTGHQTLGFAIIKKSTRIGEWFTGRRVLQLTWRSGGVNGWNYGVDNVPMQYRDAIIEAVRRATGFEVVRG